MGTYDCEDSCLRQLENELGKIGFVPLLERGVTTFVKRSAYLKQEKPRDLELYVGDGVSRFRILGMIPFRRRHTSLFIQPIPQCPLDLDSSSRRRDWEREYHHYTWQSNPRRSLEPLEIVNMVRGYLEERNLRPVEGSVKA